MVLCVDMTTYKLRERVAPFPCSHTLLGGRKRAGDLLFNPEQNEWVKVVLNRSVSVSTPILYLHKFLRTLNNRLLWLLLTLKKGLFFKSGPSTDQALLSDPQYKLEDSRKSSMFSPINLFQYSFWNKFSEVCFFLILLYIFNYNQTLGKILCLLYFITWAYFFKGRLSNVKVGIFPNVSIPNEMANNIASVC